MSNKDQLPLCDEFEKWLRDLDSGYSEASISNRISNVAKINEAYGNLLSLWKSKTFEGILDDLAYSKKDEANGEPNPSKIAIDGSYYNGLATYRSALKLYESFLQTGSGQNNQNLSPIGKKVKDVLDKIKPLCTAGAYTQKEVKDKIITPLLNALTAELESEGYSFVNEYTPDTSNIPDLNEGCKDRYDIMGESKNPNLPVIVIEVDTHRSDQVSKKMVSRLALNQDKELIYVSLIYPNKHVGREAEKKECQKYFKFITILFNMFGMPRKEYIYSTLY